MLECTRLLSFFKQNPNKGAFKENLDTKKIVDNLHEYGVNFVYHNNIAYLDLKSANEFNTTPPPKEATAYHPFFNSKHK